MIDVLRLLLSQTLTLCFPTENLWLEAITAVTTIERRQAGNDIETASTRALYNILSAILASAREVSTHGKALRMLFVIKDIHHLQGPDVAKEIIYLRAELGRMGVHVLITGRSKLANNSSWGAKGFPRVDEDTEYNEFLNSLKFDHMHTRRNQVSTPFHGTNTWIQSHPIFSKWERSQSGVLWIQGKPGSGKSVLAKSILKTFPDVILASWFYSKRGGVVGVSHTSMLRSICYQILQQKKGLFASCAQTYRRKAFSDNYHNYLTAILEAIATSEDEQPILCLLDGLDESADRDDEGGRRTLELLADLSEAPGSRLKVIVLSRPYRTIEQTYGTYDILLEAENAADIGVIIDQGLAAIATALERNGPGGLSPFARRRRQQLDGDPDDAGGILGLMSDIEQKQEIQNIKEYLVEHARGVTLWVTLSIDQALRYTSRGTVTWTSLRAMLASLPFELNEMYRVITNEITQDCTAEHVKMGRKILAWVMVASTKRPLLVKELFDAMCIPENEDIIPDGDNDPIRANRPVFKSWSYLCRSIQDICGPLLEFVTASQSGTFSYDRLSKVTGRSVVQLIHQTAKDYLEGGQDTVFAFESSEVLSVVTNEARSYMMLVIPPSPRKYTPVLSDVADDWKSKVVAMLTYLDDKFLLPFVLSHFPPNSDYVETAERLALSTDSHWILSAFYNHMTYREIETPGVLEETVVGWCFTVACNMGLHTAIDNLLYLTSLHPGWWAVHREAVLGVALQVAKTRQIADLADRIQENRDSFVWPAIQRSESDRPDILLRASLSRRQSRTGIIAIGRMETLDWIDSNNHNMRPACEPVLPSTARVSDVREAICRILHYLSGNMHPLGLNVNSMTSGLRRSVGAGTPSRSLSGAALGSRVSTLRVGDTSQTQSWASTLEENSQDHTNWI
ncbi:hypothetical protein F5Y10DRAFT_236734 [Nemania abortiva]|nr:hypothetical protein F5Y10DRAFT_236734 [Nemania abortiva]